MGKPKFADISKTAKLSHSYAQPLLILRNEGNVWTSTGRVTGMKVYFGLTHTNVILHLSVLCKVKVAQKTCY